MGIVFGYTGCAEPTYKTLHQGGQYAVRQYSNYFIAEAAGAQQKEDSFRLLAKYIGVSPTLSLTLTLLIILHLITHSLVRSFTHSLGVVSGSSCWHHPPLYH